jgi:hypothetical protein
MWWNRKKTDTGDGARIASLRLRVEGLEDEMLKMQRAATDQAMGLAALESRFLSWQRRGRAAKEDNGGAQDAPRPTPFSEAMRQVQIRRGAYGVPAGVPHGDEPGNGG